MVHATLRAPQAGCGGADPRRRSGMAQRIDRLTMKKLSHIDSEGQARMVDVSSKPFQVREAVAQAEIRLSRQTLALMQQHKMAKGNVLATARLAGVMAAKKAGDLIPLCHPLALSHC